ncbi:hypothetical protein C8R45DRAFT_562126 [Mycena sanguinolenta]|nr:hypothetical protein C8R45DRAFT_562126 [Mycena sanguinolenta]
MYNRSIVLLNPGAGLAGTPFGTIAPSAAVSYNALLSNDTVMQEWRDSIQVFNETDRVPVLEYLRPIPRRKSLGSALTSVFSATFAMVATVWTIFSMVARALARASRHHEDAGWKASKDRPSFALEESKWGLNELGYSEGASLNTANEERVSDDVWERIAVLEREIYSMRGQLRQRGVLDSE